VRRAGGLRLGAFGVLFLVLLVWLQIASPVCAAAEGHERRAPRSVLKVAFGSFPDYLDPQLSYTNEGWTAMYETYIPLLTYRRAGGKAGAEVIPGLARDLPQISDGGRTYTLFLRRGLKYSDGTRVHASDFECAIKRLLRLHSGLSPFYKVIVGTRGYQRRKKQGISGIVTDNRTGKIVIRLRKPRGTFTSLLALLAAAPVPPDTPMRDLSFDPPPATGPYAVEKVGFRGWSYKRNPAWRSGNGRLLPQLPDGHVHRIEARVIRDDATRLRRVLRGKLDWMQAFPPFDRYAELQRKYEGTRFRADPTLTAEYFWMNTTKPPFDDIQVRRAANHAVDREVLRGIYGGQLFPSQQVLPAGMPGYRELDLYPYDLAKARRLIAAADPADRKVTVWTDAEAPHLEAATYYRGQLQEIGLRAELKVSDESFGYFGEIGNTSTPNLDTGWANWFHDYPHPDDFFRPLLHSSSVARFFNGNFAQLDVPALDAKIEGLSKDQLGPVQERRYAALDRRVTELAPWVSYGSPMAATIVSKAVDLDRVIWNPTFGTALTSFRFE
jgi:peptide/nickel transport system substrate-binding protein